MQTMQNNSAILKYFPFIATLLCMIKQRNLVSMIPYTKHEQNASVSDCLTDISIIFISQFCF